MLNDPEMHQNLHQTPKVALLIKLPGILSERILAGITRYVGPDGRWSLVPEIGFSGPEWLTSSRWDGIIYFPSYPGLSPLIQSTKTPVVVLHGLSNGFDLPWVDLDNAAIGRMGADHLIERGFLNFAFCGFSDCDWSPLRADSFRATVEEKGFPVALHESTLTAGGSDWNDRINEIAQWLKGLPKPIGIMACNDHRGINVIDACRRAGFRIPEDVAIVGADNEARCQFCNPPLSSIRMNVERMGYEAAKLLDSLMKGESLPEKGIMIPPIGVMTRQSTDTLATADWLVAEAARFIRENSLHGCKVSDVQKHLHVGRTTLKAHFQKALNRSPQSEIHRVRIERIKSMLSHMDLTLAQIAEETGFEHAEYLGIFFKRETGLAPSEYRKHILNSDDG